MKTTQKEIRAADRKIRAALLNRFPPLSDTEAAGRKIKVDRDGFAKCRVCGCTQREPCNPPCGWFEADLCTSCAMTADALLEWTRGARWANRTALWREVERREK